MAKQTLTGTVSMVSEKDWEDRKTGEDIVLYSFQIEGDKRYFRTGTDDPGIDEGACVRFVFDSKGNKVDVDTIEEIDESEVERAPKPRRRSGKTRGASRASTSGTSRKASGGEDWNARQKYWEEKERRDVEVVEPRITFSAAQRDAVSVVTAALAADALSFGRTAQGKKLDLLLDFVDEVAMRFYDQRFNLDLPVRKGSDPDAATSDDDYDE